jgi:hypothetical protein
MADDLHAVAYIFINVGVGPFSSPIKNGLRIKAREDGINGSIDRLQSRSGGSTIKPTHRVGHANKVDGINRPGVTADDKHAVAYIFIDAT